MLACLMKCSDTLPAGFGCNAQFPAKVLSSRGGIMAMNFSSEHFIMFASQLNISKIFNNLV